MNVAICQNFKELNAIVVLHIHKASPSLYRWLPLVPNPADINVNFAVLTIFLYSCNNLSELEDGSVLTGEAGVPEENQVSIQVLLSSTNIINVFMFNCYPL